MIRLTLLRLLLLLLFLLQPIRGHVGLMRLFRTKHEKAEQAVKLVKRKETEPTRRPESATLAESPPANDRGSQNAAARPEADDRSSSSGHHHHPHHFQHHKPLPPPRDSETRGHISTQCVDEKTMDSSSRPTPCSGNDWMNAYQRPENLPNTSFPTPAPTPRVTLLDRGNLSYYDPVTDECVASPRLLELRKRGVPFVPFLELTDAHSGSTWVMS